MQAMRCTWPACSAARSGSASCLSARSPELRGQIFVARLHPDGEPDWLIRAGAPLGTELKAVSVAPQLRGRDPLRAEPPRDVRAGAPRRERRLLPRALLTRRRRRVGRDRRRSRRRPAPGRRRRRERRPHRHRRSRPPGRRRRRGAAHHPHLGHAGGAAEREPEPPVRPRVLTIGRAALGDRGRDQRLVPHDHAPPARRRQRACPRLGAEPVRPRTGFLAHVDARGALLDRRPVPELGGRIAGAAHAISARADGSTLVFERHTGTTTAPEGPALTFPGPGLTVSALARGPDGRIAVAGTTGEPTETKLPRGRIAVSFENIDAYVALAPSISALRTR